MIGWVLIAGAAANLRGGNPPRVGGVWDGGQVRPTPRGSIYPCSCQYWRLFDEAERALAQQHSGESSE